MRQLSRRIRPGSENGEPVQVEELRHCECPHCEFQRQNEMHWFPVGIEMNRKKAEAIVRGHNAVLGKI